MVTVWMEHPHGERSGPEMVSWHVSQKVQQTIVRQAAAVHVTERADCGSGENDSFAVEGVGQIVKRVR